MNIFEALHSVNVNGHTEKKNGLTYLSWAWAWAEVKKRYPDATYTVYERPDGVIYWTDGKTCWVKTGLTINGLEHIEYLPVMDYKNRSIPVENVTSMDVNKAIQRSLTKAAARHGLGLYIYAGEDLPEGDSEERESDAEPKEPAEKAPEIQTPKCERCGAVITGVALPDGSAMTASELIGKSKLTYNGIYCWSCMKELNRKRRAG